MTATTGTISCRRGRVAFDLLRRSALTARSIVRAIGARWSDIVDGGQLGPTPDTTIGRHTGARI